MSNMEIGKYGEKVAADYLSKNGCKIVETNYRFSKYGEVDIVALDGEELCFVEVKTRTQNRFGMPFEAITKNKLSKIYSCARNYTATKPIKYRTYRIDAISIELEKNKNPKIEHIKNVQLY